MWLRNSKAPRCWPFYFERPHKSAQGNWNIGYPFTTIRGLLLCFVPVLTRCVLSCSSQTNEIDYIIELMLSEGKWPSGCILLRQRVPWLIFHGLCTKYRNTLVVLEPASSQKIWIYKALAVIAFSLLTWRLAICKLLVIISSGVYHLWKMRVAIVLGFLRTSTASNQDRLLMCKWPTYSYFRHQRNRVRLS